MNKKVMFALLFLATSISLSSQNLDSLPQGEQALEIADKTSDKNKFENTSSKTVITAQDILERGYDNLDELLSSVQGVSLTHDRTFTQIGIRGISPTADNNQRVKVLLDGVPLNNPATGTAPSGFDLQGIAMEDIEEVIVIRSASPVEHGNNAMLGLIKINTKKAKKGLRLNFDMGSYGELDGGFAVGQTIGKTTLGLSGRLADMSGQQLYIPSDSILEKEASTFGGLRMRLSQGKFSFNGFYNRWEEQRNGIPTAPNQLFSSFDPLVDLDGFRGFRRQIDTVTELKGKQLYADLSFSTPIKTNQFIDVRLFVNFENQEQKQYFEDDIFEYFVLDTALMLVDSFAWSKTNFYETPKSKSLWLGLDYQHSIELDEKHSLRFGTNLLALPISEYEKKLRPTYYEFIPDNESTTTDFPEEVTQFLDSYNDSLFIEKSFFKLWSVGLFVQDQYRFNEKIALQGGLRLELNSQTKPVLAPELSVLLSPFGNNTQLRLGYLQGYRLPSLLETNAGAAASIMPVNRDFSPEKSHSFEFGWVQKIGKGLEFNTTLYHQELQDLVWNEFSDPPSQVDSLIGVTGLEGGLGFQLPKGIRSYLNYNFQFDRKQIYNMPSPLCKFGITVPVLKHFSVFTEGQYEGSRKTLTGANTLPYFLWNANLLIQPKVEASNPLANWLNKVHISFRVFNILDQFYQHPTETERVSNGLIPQNGRTWQTQLTLQF